MLCTKSTVAVLLSASAAVFACAGGVASAGPSGDDGARLPLMARMTGTGPALDAQPIDIAAAVETTDTSRHPFVMRLRGEERVAPGVGGMPALCYDTRMPPSQKVMAAIEASVHGAINNYNQQGSRWPGSAGAPVTITWSFIPDGTNIPSGFNGDVAGPSILFSQMDAAFGGSRATWIAQFQAAFDRWASLTGTSYTRVTFGGNPWDDGAVFGNGGAAGAAGVRGDVRIGGRNIDGLSSVLAYNYYPQFGGDMVLDTSDGPNWANSSNSYRFLRNVLTHEHGHGLGLAHVCPSNGTKLMEPFVNTGYDGPQHDDLRGIMNLYGDAYESNNTAASATNLGTLPAATTFNPSAVPAPAITNGSVTSVDINGDQDWFRLNLTAGNNISVTVAPLGLNYDSSTQNSNGSCNSGSFHNSLNDAALSVQIIGSNGVTVIAGNNAVLGTAAVLTNVAVPAGAFYVKVFSNTANTQSQLYNLSISSGSTPAPFNDLCASAPFIGLGTISGSNIGAQPDGGDSCRGNANADVWYQFTSPCTGTLILDTCGSPLDTVISVHTGCPGTSANQIGCNDDNPGTGPCPGGLTSYLTVPVTGGVNYKIRMAGFGGNLGNFQLTLGFGGPANDNCANAIAVGAGGVYTGQTCGATNDYAGECGASQSTPDVWYVYTPSCNHTLVLNTCGSNYDTVLGVYSGACGSLTLVGCDDDSGSNGPCPNTFQSYLAVPVLGGQSYHIRVSGFAGSVGNYVLNVGSVQQSNDLCANAITIPDGTYTGGTCGTTRDGNDTCRPTATAGDVWYRWVAPCTGNLVLNTCGSNYDTDITVYTGTCGNLSQISCNDDGGPCGGTLQSFLSVPVSSGTAYMIRVSGFAANTGSFVLDVHQQPNDTCASAISVGTGITNFDTRCSANDWAGECGLSATAGDVWYSFTATCGGRVGVDLCGSTYDTVVSVYSGGCGALTNLACNDDGPSGHCSSNNLASFTTFIAVQGQTYKIRVSGFAGATGTGQMNLFCLCVADVDDGSSTGTPDGGVTIDDLLYYLQLFANGDSRADVDDGSGTGTQDGGVTIDDLLYFLAHFAAGC